MRSPLRRLAARARRGGGLLGAAFARWIDVEAYRLGAALSLYALLSMMPLMLLSLGVLQAVLGDSQYARNQAVAWFDASSSPEVRDLMSKTIEGLTFGTEGSVWSVVIGIVGALLGASGVFAELDTALNRVFRSEQLLATFRDVVRDFVHDRLWAFLLVALTSLVVLAAGILGTVWDTAARAELGPPIVLRAVAGAGTLAVETTGIALCLRLIPDRYVPWSAAFKGAFVAAVGLTLIRAPFGLLVVHLGGYAAYGVVGTMLAIVTWIFVAANVLLFGASVGAVLCEREEQSPTPRDEDAAWKGATVMTHAPR